MAIRNTQGKTNIMSPLGSLVSIPRILRQGYALCSCSMQNFICIKINIKKINTRFHYRKITSSLTSVKLGVVRIEPAPRLLSDLRVAAFSYKL